MAMSDDPDRMLLGDPYLSYINQLLMDEEEEESAAGMESVDDFSYQATFSGFHDILSGKGPQPSSCCDDSSCGHTSASDVCCGAGDGANNLSPLQGHGSSGAPGLLMPNRIHSSHHEAAEAGFKQNRAGSGLQGRIVANPTDELLRLHDERVDVSDLDDRHCVMGGQEQGNDIFKVPLTDEELSLKLAEIELSFEEFKVKDIYSDLYAHSTQASVEIEHRGQKRMGRNSCKPGKLESDAFVDVEKALMRCAEAVAIGDAKTAKAILQELWQVHGASASGTSSQRIAYFFSNALEARMRGTGEHQFREMSCKVPSSVTILQATKVAFELTPFLKVIHYYANQSILKAAEGASRLHIVDFGLMYGIQWPCLISALAERKGGPPFLVLTGIEHPRPGVNPAKRLEKSGRQLASYAKACNVPFQYHSIVSNKWEDLDAASLKLHKGEVLVVNCIKCLCHLADESVNLVLDTCPRQKLFTLMRSLNPHLLLIAVSHAALNVPFFVSRFREALHRFSNTYDMIDTLWGDDPQRKFLERSWFYREILNIVGCEGAERVERLETYKEWHARITKAGFEQLPLLSTTVSRIRSHVRRQYHKDFLIYDDGKGWMLMGWKGCTSLGVSAWKPRNPC